MTAALPKEEAPRCLVCDRDLVACRLFTDEAKATCYQRGYERSTAAHQKTLDALEAVMEEVAPADMSMPCILCGGRDPECCSRVAEARAALLAGGRNV